MKKIFKKMSKTLMTMLMSLSVVVSMFGPAVVMADEPADSSGYYQIEFKTGVTEVENVTDASSVEVTIDDNTKITVEGEGLYSNASSKFVYSSTADIEITASAESDKQVRVDLAGTQYTLKNAESENITLSSNYSQVDLSVENIPSNPAGNTVNVAFDGGTRSGNVVTFNVDGTDVTATITGTYADDVNASNNINIAESDLNNVIFELSNSFDKDSMTVTVIDTENHELSVNGDNEFTLNGFSGNLHVVISSQNGGNNPGTENNVEVTFDTDMVAGNQAAFTVDSKTVTVDVGGADINDKKVLVPRNDLASVTFTLNNAFDNDTMQIVIRGADNYSTILNVNENNVATLNGLGIPNGGIHFNVEEKSNNNNPEPQQGNTEATINVITGTGTYEYVDGNNETRTANYTGAFTDDPEKVDGVANIAINGSMSNPENGEVSYNSNEEDTTVTFSFISFWHMRYYDEIVINDGTNEHTYNVSDYIDFTDRTDVLNHLDGGGQMISFDIPDVPKADSYDVTVKIGRASEVYVGNFLWTADPEQADSENYIGHSKLEIVKAEYTVDGTKYTITEDEIKANQDYDGHRFNSFVSPDGYLNYGVEANVDYDDGSMVLPAGALVTMRVVPEYGYQVTSVNDGGEFTTTDDGVSEFTVEVQPGAAYFRATVEAVDDEVVSNTKKVSSGTVEIADNEIDAGTVRLSVDDVELSNDKIKDFENAANGYTINSYLDINLNQVFYQGTSDKVWSNQIHHLNKEALITLKLADGVDVSNIVIVHNIDDGEKFEIIEIESYDAKTNTITFRTKSFSNYAIATKTEVAKADTKEDTTTTTSSKSTSTKESTKNPKTVDNVNKYTYGLVLSLVGITYLVIVLKKRELVK